MKLLINTQPGKEEAQDWTESVNLMEGRVEEMDGRSVVKTGTEMAAITRAGFAWVVATSREVDAQVREITAEIGKMTIEIKKVEGMSQSIATIAEESSAGSQEVTASAEEQATSAERSWRPPKCWPKWRKIYGV